MGADITFYDENEKEIFYFRDSYNDTNLAHVINLSYWQYIKKTKKSKIDFFIKLSEISKKQIENHCKMKNITIETKYFTDKVDLIKKNLEKIKNCKSIDWFV